jgi:hypothetical protein
VSNVLVLSDEELAWIGEGLDVLLGALDETVMDREHLAAARAALDRHSCWLCPLEARALFANAHNAVVNYGSERERKKMGDLMRAVNSSERDIDAHFRATNDFQAQQTACARLAGCGIRPGGHFHDADCPVEHERRR